MTTSVRSHRWDHSGAPDPSLPSGTGSPAEFRQPPLEQAPLGVVVGQSQRSTVRIDGLVRSTEASQ